MTISRRGFLSGIIAACAAPAIIRTAGLIMPIKPVWIDHKATLLASFHQRMIEAREIMAAQIVNNMFTLGNIDEASRTEWDNTFLAGRSMVGGYQEGDVITFEIPA